MESKNNSEAHKAFKDVHFAQEYLSALTSALAMKKKL